MTLTKEQARENLNGLVSKFKSEFEAGKTVSYNEEATKQSFIGPLLSTVLGWDITNHDEESDNLVYELYGITEEERRIIEG